MRVVPAITEARPEGGSQLVVDNLRYRYRRRATWALDGLSFRTASRRTAVLGPNGAGKTTLLRLLSTAARPVSGQFSVEGFASDAPHHLDQFRAQLGVVPQRLVAMGGLTVPAFLSYVAWLRGVPNHVAQKRVDVVMDALDLGGCVDARLGTLSGGLRQRVSLAQALVNRPRLLLLDEPTVSLDPAQRDGFLSLLRHVDTATTILMTSHVAEDVAAFAEDVVVVDNGKVTYAGTLAAFCGREANEPVLGGDVKRAYIAHLQRRQEGRGARQ